MDVEADLWDSGLLGLYTKHVEGAVLRFYALGSPDMMSHEIPQVAKCMVISLSMQDMLHKRQACRNNSC